MNWISDRIFISKYALKLIFTGFACLVMPISYWVEVVKREKARHSHLHFVRKIR